MIGQSISHYKILEKLGEGGMGVVYKARDTKLDRDVALKFLPDRVNENETEKARFLQEAKAAGGLNHANICTIHSVEESGQSIFMVMEYIDGGTLRKKIPFAKTDDAVVAAMQIAEALQEAHSKGIVHRDVKADNVMLTSKGQVKVMDFGLAKLKGSLKLTKTSSTVGTLGYMAPEQIQGGEVDHRSDIFSFGVLLFEMLTGKLPFRGEHEAAMVYSIVNEEPQDIAQLLPELSPIVGNLIHRCLEKDPANRYQHFDDIVADLRRSRQKTSRVMRSQSGPVPVAQAGSSAQQAQVQPAPVQGAGSSAEIPAPKPGRPRTIMIGVAAIVVVLAAVVFWIFRPSPESAGTVGKTIAVLPFENASGDKDDEFFTEGVTEDILTQLSKISGLTVLSRFTLKDYDSKGKTPKTIGAELNVSSLLVGSIRRSGDRVRINCQLINTSNEAEVWAEAYDRQINDVFSIQSEIARKISTALRATLTSADNERLSALPKTNTDAHNAYLQGRYFRGQPGREALKKAIPYFERAIAYDSTYAPAWQQLASAHFGLGAYGILPATDGYSLAKREVEKALTLDPNLADAYGTLAWLKQTFDWDWKGADAAVQHGLDLDPGNRGLIGRAADLAMTLGRFDEAVSLYRRMVEIDPLKSGGYYNLSLTYLHAGRDMEAETACRKAIELSPTESGYHANLSLILLHQSKPQAALEELQNEPEVIWRSYVYPIIYQALGRKKDADSTMKEFIRKYQDVGAYQVALVYAYRGNVDKAFEWLDKAYALRDGGLSEIIGEPLARSLKSDPRYAAFMKKMNLPVL